MNSTQDWFMMTGDLIINLRSSNTGDSFRFSKQPNKKKIAFEDCKSLEQALEDTNPELCPLNGDDDQLLETCFQHDANQQMTTSPANDSSVVPSPEEVSCTHDTDGDHGKSDEEPNHADKNTLASGKSSNSSSGNSSGATDEELSNSHSFSDSYSLSSPTKPYAADFRTNESETYSPEEFCYFYDGNYNGKEEEDNCYENIGECNYLSKSHESNLYNLIEDSKSFDNISIDSESGSMVELNSGKTQCIDAPSAHRLAKRLFNLEGFQKSDVTRHLSKNNEYSRTVAEEYLRLFNFAGKPLDEALRSFLSRFYLTGETQERERVLVYFSKRFHSCNPDASNFKSIDSIHTLTCALMLLNTDLHEENIQRKMTCSDFILNLSGMNDGSDYPSEFLKYLYYSIKQKPLGWNNDEMVDASKSNRNVFSKITTISRSISSPYATLPRKFSGTLCSNPFVEVPNPTFAIEYKKGYIRRKCCYEANGKKTSIGRRSWKMFYATLRDLVLYLHKDEHGFRKSQQQESFANSIRIHHSIASVANDYPKKKFVFRLVTVDNAEFLFETSDSRELQSWVDTLNTTTASLSAPALPMAVSSDSSYKFKRAIFPVCHTKLSLIDQLKDQESKLLSLKMDLESLLEKSGRNSTNKIYPKDFVEKENYLQHEVKRYRVYITCLKRRLKKQASEQGTSSEHHATSQDSSSHKSSTFYSDNDSNAS